MTKIRTNLFKMQSQSREITSQIFIIFRLPSSSLLFKTRTKIGVCTVAKPHVIFQSFLLEMLGFIDTFMTVNFNPKLLRGFEAIAI